MNKNKIGRNDPCPCKSGKKYKYCCLGKKERRTCISADLGLAHDIFPGGAIPAGTSFKISHTENSFSVSVSDNPIQTNSLTLQNTYVREKAPKILSQIPIKAFSVENLLNTNSIHELYTQYDVIFIVDTNTKILNNKSISISFSIICTVTLVRPGEAKYDYKQYNAFRYENLTPGEAEKKGIYDTIQSIIKNNGYNNKYQIGIISDSDLANHIRINNKEIPIYNNYYLPKNFKLLYSSGEVGMENPLNKLMKLCDKAATDELKRIIDTDFPVQEI